VACEAAKSSDTARHAKLNAVPTAIMSRQNMMRSGTRLVSLSEKNFTLPASNFWP
jgi:hypothetical protein